MRLKENSSQFQQRTQNLVLNELNHTAFSVSQTLCKELKGFMRSNSLIVSSNEVK